MQMNDDPLEIEAGGNGYMMQVRFGQPIVRRAPQPRRAQRLRERAFDARTTSILLHKRWAALHRSPLQQGGMHLWGREGERATSLPARTLGSHRTASAGGRGKADHHAWMLASIRRLRSEEHTSELQSRQYLVCRLLLEK